MKLLTALPLRRRAALLLALAPALLLAGILFPPAASSDPFVDPAFMTLWNRADGPVAGRVVARTWLWGPTPGPAKREPYAEGTGGVRLVQYFDKGRMEINNPAGDPNAPFYVTGGLLSVELISGQAQTGDARFESRGPAAIPLASDRDDPNAPTYASFGAVSSLSSGEHAAASAVGAAVNQSIDRAGIVGPLSAGQTDHGVRYAYFEPLTKHNVADVFWQFLNSTGPVQVAGQVSEGPLFQPWFAQTGLPISEAYWAHVKIAGRPTDTLIQAFQRRVLTFTPTNPAGWQVEMGNIGLHYLEWRYSTGAAPAPAGSPAPVGPPPLPAVVITGIVTGKSGLDLNEQSVSLVNNGQSLAVMSGWRLVSPKNDHLDVYTFPQGVTLPPGAKLTVLAGQGIDSPGTLHMRRVTWLFDATGFDGVILYDGAGREVSRYFLQQGAPPTAPPAPPGPAATETAPAGEATETPLPADVTETPTAAAGTATPTATAGAAGTVTATPTANRSVTATATGAASRTASPTVTATATRAP
jgi:hypothetical protein